MTNRGSDVTQTTSELVERAANIRRILEQHAEETDRLRRLPEANVRVLKDAGLCRLMVPKRFGGHQTDIRTYIAVMAELGRGCGSTAWVASLINVCAWLANLEIYGKALLGVQPNITPLI
jgi:3-hydroxy-9,10-secoandrosta-1,3,5(10)-triene-9,17-dione monooxygenase